MAPRFTEEQLSQLTDEEREGLLADEEAGDEDEDENDEGGAEVEDAKSEQEEDDGAGSADDDDAAAAAASEDAAAKGDTTVKAAAADDPAQAAAGAAGTDEAAQEKTPAWVLPGDFDDRIKAIKAEKAALSAKFDEGELTGDEFRQQIEAIDDRYDELREQKITANVALNAAKTDYQTAVAKFLTENPQYEEGGALYSLLDAEVRKLQANAANPLNPALLTKAHAKITADIEKAYGIKPSAPAGKKDADTPAKKEARRADPPPSLRNMPSTDIDDADDGGEFAVLNRLADKDSVAFEKELAAMRRRSPEAYDRFMAM